MAETKKITGVDAATVYVMEQIGEKKQPVPMRIDRGQELPSNLREGELQRLEKLGAFEPHTHAEKIRAQQVAASAQRAAAVAESAARALNETPGARAAATLSSQKTYDDLNKDEAIAFLEGLPEDQRASYFEIERSKNRKGVLQHFDQPTE